MDWLARILKRTLSQQGEDSAGVALDDAEGGLDTALRHTLRGEVAGAAPRVDSWMRLQQRIQQDGPTPAWFYQQPPQIPVQPVWSRRDPFSAVFLTRFTQLGAALMLLLLMLGNLRGLDNIVPLAPTPVALHSASDDTPTAAPPVEHVNRAVRILADPSPAQPTAVSTPVVEPRLAVKMEQVAQVAARPMGAQSAPVPAVRPDGGDWLHDVSDPSNEVSGGAGADKKQAPNPTGPIVMIPR